MNDPDIDKYCLVHNDDYFTRGKIYEVEYNENGCLLKVFLVDIGKTIEVNYTEVFEIPDHLIEMAPFQVRKPKYIAFSSYS